MTGADYTLEAGVAFVEPLAAGLVARVRALGLAGTGRLTIADASNLDGVRAAVGRGRRVLAVARPDRPADALDALEAGAFEIVAEDASQAELRSLLMEVNETSSAFGPRLADLTAKMATIAGEIDNLLRAPPLPPGVDLARGPVIALEPLAPTAASVRALIRARRARSNFFDANLFADPAWDLLLDLKAAQLEGKPVSVSSACIAAAVPPTTALRWIKTLTDEGMIEREADPQDGRRIFLSLTSKAALAMDAYLKRAAAMPGGAMAA